MAQVPCAKVAVHVVEVTSPTPIRCLTSGLSAMTRDKEPLPSATSSGTRNDSLRGTSGTGVDTPIGCSAYVLSSPLEGSTIGARAVNTAPPRSTSFPCFDGMNPHLWRAQCIEYFNHFNINKCMWVIAAAMHMKGKAKVWYEAYRLRQAVGDWSEFMDNAESHFGVTVLPPLVPIMGTVHPSVNVHASEDISSTTTTRCLNESPRELMDKGVVPTELTLSQITEDLKLQVAQLQMAVDKLGNVTKMAEPNAASHEEVLTHVGGVSLFLEPGVAPAEAMFSKQHQMEFEDDVFTIVGGLSLFLELVVESADGILVTSNVKDVIYNEHEGTYMQQLLWCDASLSDIAHMVEPLNKECLYDVLTHIGSSSLFLKQVTDVEDKSFEAVLLEDVSRFNEAVSPYNRNTFGPGIFIASVECYVLELSLPLQCHGFSPGSIIAKSEHLLYGSSRDTLSVPGDSRVLHLILCDTCVWNVTYSATQQWDPGISLQILGVHSLRNLQLFDSYVMRRGLSQPVLLFKSITDGVRLTLPWDPGDHVHVENTKLYTLAYDLLEGVYGSEAMRFLSIHM